MDHDVEAAKTIHHLLNDAIDPFARTDVCLDESIGRTTGRYGSCSSDHFSTTAYEALDNSFANTPGSTCTRIRLSSNSAASSVCGSISSFWCSNDSSFLVSNYFYVFTSW